MKKVVVYSLIICLFSFPYVYFSMSQDYNESSMNGYLLLLVISIILAFFGGMTNNSRTVFIGNAVSFFISYYFNSKMINIDSWDGYFKPIGSIRLLVVVSVLNLIPQLMAIKFAKSLNKKRIDTTGILSKE
ncbi:hypothetical protein ACQKM9_05320 [Viridibacillus sp. NPDC093762]|uniref:hypothetical protein n=1 Tax=Viridibacillus sp. NPDC093762 TaxID=3390720 RepID=UPI003D0088E2